MSMQRNNRRMVAKALVVALFASFFVITLIWRVWYPTVKYNLYTVMAASGIVFLSGLGLTLGIFKDFRQVGLTAKKLVQALAVTAASYAAILLIGWGANILTGASLDLLRGQYRWEGLLDNWVFTGIGEELIFSGVIFTLIRQLLPPRRIWVAVLIVAFVFALWHLPGHLAIGDPFGEIGFSLSLKAVSWLFFGTIYALSGNLWLTAFAHASTDYGLSPLVTQNPIFGLLFMAFLLAGARWLQKAEQEIETKDLANIQEYMKESRHVESRL